MAPPGFVEITRPEAKLIVRSDLADAFVHITSDGTAYEWASRRPNATRLQGRLPVFATNLPFGGPEVVIRRNCHGGLLRFVRRDRFLPALIPRELFVSHILAETFRIPTPEVVAHISYRINRFERRVDVVTLRLPAGEDLATTLLRPPGPDRESMWVAVDLLLHALADRGIWHQDLNARNIYLIAGEPPAPVLLDVDRVKFHRAGPLLERANITRLVRSLRKLRRRHGAHISDEEIARVGTRRPPPAPEEDDQEDEA